MKTKIIIYFLLILPLISFSQADIKGVICNHEKSPLPYTNVALLKNNGGTSSNEKGEFQINNICIDDTIKITNIAYYPKLIGVSKLINNDTIYLEEQIKQLSEITVINFVKFKNEKDIGFLDYVSNASYSLHPGNQMAVFIENKIKKEGWLKAVSFKVKEKGTCKNSIRVRVLQLDPKDNEPSYDILNADIILNFNDLKRTNHIDISRFKILMPKEGVFVVLEWVGPEIYCDENSYTTISGNSKVASNLVWLNQRDRVWDHKDIPQLRNGNFMTPNISLKIAYKL